MSGFWEKRDGGISGSDVRATTFAKPPMLRRGYDNREVDAFMHKVAAAFDAGCGLTATEVRRVRFTRPALGSRGYDEQSVDEFLDDIEAECARRGWQ